MKTKLIKLSYKLGYVFEYLYRSDYKTKTLIFYRAKLNNNKTFYNLKPICKLWTKKNRNEVKYF